MKTLSIILLLLISVTAHSGTTQENIARAIEAATKYANSIACGVSDITFKDVADLVPYEDMSMNEARYAVLWHGDIECMGGRWTESHNIAIVSVGAQDSFYVIPGRSSPAVQIDTPSAPRAPVKIIDYGRDYLILEGLVYHPSGKDPLCCPSLKVKTVVRVDKKGNWISQ